MEMPGECGSDQGSLCIMTVSGRAQGLTSRTWWYYSAFWCFACFLPHSTALQHAGSCFGDWRWFCEQLKSFYCLQPNLNLWTKHGLSFPPCYHAAGSACSAPLWLLAGNTGTHFMPPSCSKTCSLSHYPQAVPTDTSCSAYWIFAWIIRRELNHS